MGKRTEAIDADLENIILRRYGEQDRELLEPHLRNINREHNESEKHKKKYFRNEKWICYLALLSSVAGSVLSLWTFETNEIKLAAWVKVILSLVSVFSSFAIVALGNLKNTDKNWETWLRHRIYVNKCLDECMEFANHVGKYETLETEKANRVLLKHLVDYQKENNNKFAENMHM